MAFPFERIIASDQHSPCETETTQQPRAARDSKRAASYPSPVDQSGGIGVAKFVSVDEIRCFHALLRLRA
ncbi:hypothetical protein AQ753_17350 [Burkholderia pseudomallei]|nr:hypothetical protein AQ753_17350 [Burkholderia pseudomallei]OMT15664.1 hypothetical protein AQ754_22015 [Burkholderia pseudomallei]OMT23518.1 hypothetical protein AQ755_14580 [Burkholderia pseudomallei]